ncbi:hypothetical protein ACH4ND_04190 [Streptomyces sp. NPDC017179]|uniref:hypothetical protein n=1 Tax=Streptomyces sp. NPDC017179 TaxID=3364979 RepID=UPI00379088E1
MAAQIRQRRRIEREGGEPIRLKMPVFPYVTIAWTAGVLAVVVVVPETRPQVGLSFLSPAVVPAAYGYRVRDRRRVARAARVRGLRPVARPGRRPRIPRPAG